MKRMARRYPVLTFFVLTAALGWVAVAVGSAIMPIDAEHPATAMHGVLIFAIASPSVIGMLITGIVDGRQGFRETWFRLTKWRVHVTWYAAALLLPFSVAGVSFLILDALGGPVAPIDLADQIKFMLPFGIMAPIFEELGWRGFALPRLQKRYNALVSALIVGCGWAMWHTAINYLGVAGLHKGPMLVGLLLIVAQLNLADSVIMSWIHNNTGGSMLLVLLAHFSITMGNVFTPATVSTFDFVFATLTSVTVHLLVAVILVVVFGPRHLSRNALPRVDAVDSLDERPART